MMRNDDAQETTSTSSDDASSSTSSVRSDVNPPVLETLVRHFVAAKRSLSSTQHIWRANEIVAHGKTALEDIVTYDAKTQFLKSGVDRQLSTLNEVRNGLENVGVEVDTEFKSILRHLDDADARVKQSIEKAKVTLVESSLRPKDEKPRSLYDFIDEQGMDGLTATFRKCIDNTNEAQVHFATSNKDFDTRLQALRDKLSHLSSASPKHETLLVGSNYNSIETHATEMADLLRSLVHHYDLCVTALKHTEGGNEAAVHAQAEIPTEASTATLDKNAPPLPMSDDEHSELMQVLESDAAEVDDVVEEIRERAIEMESQLDMITDQSKQLKHDYKDIRDAARLQDDIGERLNQFIDAGSILCQRWSEIKAHIEVNMEELEGLCDFYAGFLQAYDGLLLEVARRKNVESRMSKIALEAMSKIDELCEEDIGARERFKTEHGDFLPKDILPNLQSLPPRYEVRLRDTLSEKVSGET